jgi:hypothetical protein
MTDDETAVRDESAFARECKKLDEVEEQAPADEVEWPEY